MLRKVINKKRRHVWGTEREEELVIVCSTEQELLEGLSGYRFPSGARDAANPQGLVWFFCCFDATQPHLAVTLTASNGATDTLTLHTLH